MDAPNDNSDPSRWTYVERLKVIAEICAIIVAGLWALKLYYETEWPAQEKRLSMQSDLKWTAQANDGCLAEYTVTIKNVGKTSIDLPPALLQVWRADPPVRTNPVEYLDAHKLMEGTPAIRTTLTHEEFGSHYPPDTGDTVTMTVMVKRDPGHPLLFGLVFPDRPWLDYRWDYACDEPGESKNTNSALTKAPARRKLRAK